MIDTTVLTAHLADAISEITGNDDYDAVASYGVQLYMLSETARFAAACFDTGKSSREDFTDTVRAILTESSGF